MSSCLVLTKNKIGFVTQQAAPDSVLAKHKDGGRQQWIVVGDGFLTIQ